MVRKKDTQPILYEMMYILDPELGEDGIERMNNLLRERVTNGGGIIEKDQSWGVRQLAYEIKKRQQGYYHILEFRAPPNLPSSLATFIRTQIGILRHLIIKVSKTRVLQEERDAAVAARRAAAAQAAEQERIAQAAERERIAQAKAAEEVESPAIPSSEEIPSPPAEESPEESPLVSVAPATGESSAPSDGPEEEETTSVSADTPVEEETPVPEMQDEPQPGLDENPEETPEKNPEPSILSELPSDSSEI